MKNCDLHGCKDSEEVSFLNNNLTSKQKKIIKAKSSIQFAAASIYCVSSVSTTLIC